MKEAACAKEIQSILSPEGGLEATVEHVSTGGTGVLSTCILTVHSSCCGKKAGQGGQALAYCQVRRQWEGEQ